MIFDERLREDMYNRQADRQYIAQVGYSHPVRRSFQHGIVRRVELTDLCATGVDSLIQAIEMVTEHLSNVEDTPYKDWVAKTPRPYFYSGLLISWQLDTINTKNLEDHPKPRHHPADHP